MFHYPHTCTISRRAPTAVEGRVLEDLQVVAANVPCFFDDTPATTGIASRQRYLSDANMITRINESLLLLPPTVDVRIADRVDDIRTSLGGRLPIGPQEVKYVRHAMSFVDVDHLEVHLTRNENR